MRFQPKRYESLPLAIPRLSLVTNQIQMIPCFEFIIYLVPKGMGYKTVLIKAIFS